MKSVATKVRGPQPGSDGVPFGSVGGMGSDLHMVAHGVIEAVLHGDPSLAHEVFHPEATITGQQDGILVRCGVAEYMEVCRRLRLPRRRPGHRYRILMAETEGPVGFLKLAETYPEGEVISYMTLSKVNGRWLVNNRTLHGTGRAPLVRTASARIANG